LRKVLCKLCGNDYKIEVISVNDIAKTFNITNIAPKLELNGVLTEIQRDETGRIININVLGHYMKGEEFANRIGCKSSRIYFQENSITFKSIGEGSGLGICLAGADVLAQRDYKFKDIIEYYYTGISFVELDENSLLNSLTGKRIVIDPGHGGNDVGNTFGTIIEKNVNLVIALELEKSLNGKGAQVILTRNADDNVPLGNRVNLINTIKPEIFISIHQNSFIFSSTNGVEAYCYEMDEDGIKLSEHVEFFMNQELKIKNRGVKIGDYHLLRETKVSGIILECMYMSGDCDSLRYKDEFYVGIADCIFKGICRFYGVE
jgi:N-acetylmuramoyl-L-alanine amidase